MHKLLYEISWDKNLSMKDRSKIEQIYLESSRDVGNDTVSFTPLWQAVNHKEDLLVTVIVQNFCDSDLHFNEKTINYLENDKVMASHTFSLPTFTVPSQTSMPWTFIFPKNKLQLNPTLQNGYLELMKI